MTTPIRLTSNAMIGAPGFAGFVARAWLWQPSVAMDLIGSTWPNLPAWAAICLLAGKFRCEDGTVIIDPPAEDAFPRTPLTVAEQEREREVARGRERDEDEDEDVGAAANL